MVLVPVALVEGWLVRGVDALEPAGRVPRDLALVEVRFDPPYKARGLVAMVFESREWDTESFEVWEPRYRRKGGAGADHRPS